MEGNMSPKTEIENCFPGKSPSPCGRGRGGGVTLKVNYSPSPLPTGPGPDRGRGRQANPLLSEPEALPSRRPSKGRGNYFKISKSGFGMNLKLDRLNKDIE
jgi:hypothetical protein